MQADLRLQTLFKWKHTYYNDTDLESKISIFFKILWVTCSFNFWIILLSWIVTSSLLAGLRSLLFVYCSQMNRTHLFQSAFSPPVMRILPARCNTVLGTTGVTRHAFLVSPHTLSLSLPFLAVSHAKLHPAQMHANTVPATEKPIFKLYLKKQVWRCCSPLVGGSV